MVTLLNIVMRISDALFFVLFWAIVIRVFISWFSPDPFNPLVQFLSGITDPILNFFRRFLPLQIGMMDFAPFVVLILIQLLQMAVNRGLIQLMMMSS
jgi:YggT family protein